jgi:hypothetical protein
VPQFVGEIVLWILCPREPDLADLDRVVDRLRLQKAGEVIPVLVRDDQPVEVPAGRVADALRDLLHALRRVGCPLQHTAVDQQMARLAAVGARQQEAVAEALPVHADAQLHQNLCNIAKGSTPSLIRSPKYVAARLSFASSCR